MRRLDSLLSNKLIEMSSVVNEPSVFCGRIDVSIACFFRLSFIANHCSDGEARCIPRARCHFVADHQSR